MTWLCVGYLYTLSFRFLKWNIFQPFWGCRRRMFDSQQFCCFSVQKIKNKTWSISVLTQWKSAEDDAGGLNTDILLLQVHGRRAASCFPHRALSPPVRPHNTPLRSPTKAVPSDVTCRCKESALRTSSIDRVTLTPPPSIRLALTSCSQAPPPWKLFFPSGSPSHDDYFIALRLKANLHLMCLSVTISFFRWRDMIFKPGPDLWRPTGLHFRTSFLWSPLGQMIVAPSTITTQMTPGYCIYVSSSDDAFVSGKKCS